MYIIREAIGKDGNSHLFYGVHFEVVAWENGCNVWYQQPTPEKVDRPVTPTKLLAESFKLEGGQPIEITVKVEVGRAEISVNGKAFSVSHPQIPRSYHIGYTACEGINKLYGISIK